MLLSAPLHLTDPIIATLHVSQTLALDCDSLVFN